MLRKVFFFTNDDFALLVADICNKEQIDDTEVNKIAAVIWDTIIGSSDCEGLIVYSKFRKTEEIFDERTLARFIALERSQGMQSLYDI